MGVVYLPVEPITGYDSKQRSDALDAECWSLYRPDSIKSPNDVTRRLFPELEHPTTGQWAIIGETTEQVYISPEVDLTNLIALLPEVPQVEKDMLVAYIEANKGGYVPFENLVPSTSTQLTEAEAVAAGWPPVTPEE